LTANGAVYVFILLLTFATQNGGSQTFMWTELCFVTSLPQDYKKLLKHSLSPRAKAKQVLLVYWLSIKQNPD
jgi:hypothetical protein